ncbi:MAG: TonB-dependent siderophore receptor [Marinicella sp.]
MNHKKLLLIPLLMMTQSNSWAQSDTDNADSKKTDTEQLEEIKVTASTSGLISYVSATGAKTDTPIVDTPSSVSVLTAKRFEDLGAETIQDALGYVAGVYNGPYGVDSRGDWSQIRSVAPIQYLDGLRTSFNYYNNIRPNPYGIQQVEILKGPSSVLYGQGSLGGIVNMVSKKPQAEFYGELWGQLGSFDRRQLAADFTGAVNEDASVLFRTVALFRDSGTQTDYVADDSIVISPSMTFHLSNQTELTFIGNWQKNETGSSTQFFPHMGTRLPAPNGRIPVNRFVSEPEFDRYDSEQQALTALFNHDFMNGWALQGGTRYSDSSVDYRTMYGWPPVFQDDGRSLLRSIYISDNRAKSITSDVRLHGEKLWGSALHKIVVGIDYQNAKTDNDSLFLYGAGGLLDLYDPVYGLVTDFPTPADVIDSPANHIYQTGLYLQDQVYLGDHWIVSAALRRDGVKNKTAVSTSQLSEATTGRVGLMYQFENNISPYFSYSESFDPIIGEDAYGNPYDPRTGEQFELGLKYQPLGTEHLITASVYQITEQNRTTPLSAADLQDPNIVNPSGSIQVGEAEITGLEIESQFEFNELDIYASYSYTDSEITRSNTVGELGARLAATPDHMFSTWATYRPENFWPGFKLGAGVRYVGETSDGSARVVGADGTVLNEPLLTQAYTLFDFMIGYEKGAYDFSLNVDNLTDKTTTTSCLARGDCFYGQKRTITASVKYQF